MEQKDKEILKSINGFVLYCKGFYKHTDFMYKDLKILLSDNYTINSEKDIFFIILNRWNQWNEKLPQEERMTVSKFIEKCDWYKTIYKVSGASFSVDEFDYKLFAIMEHIRYIDTKYLDIIPPIYKKGNMRYGLDKQGMTYKEMNCKINKFFNK